MARLQDVDIPYLEFAEAAAPATGASAITRIYVKADGLFYSKDDAGVETLVSGGSGGAVATDAIWDVAGDLAVGTGANTAARLALGAAGGALSRVNGAAAWNSGTSFPAAATGDRYWRTDLGQECYYDGTRWLTTTLYREPLGQAEGVIGSTTDQTVGRATVWHTDYDLWMLDFWASNYVATTNNATNYWTCYLAKVTAANVSTTIATYNTSADTVNNYVTHKVAINAALGTTHKTLLTATQKTLTPGAIFTAAAFSYRLIVT